MVEKNFVSDAGTKKLYIYKAGIRIGSEEYKVTESESGISITSYSAYSHVGNDVRQKTLLLMDKDYDTLKLEVECESRSFYQRYTFTYKNSEAHIWVDQESRIPNWTGKKLDKTIIWDKKCQVIPSTDSFFSLLQTCKKYSFDSKGKQEVACGIVPKVIFTEDYLGEDIVEVKDQVFGCKRFQLTSSLEGTTADIWIDESHDIFKILIGDKMITIQSFELY